MAVRRRHHYLEQLRTHHPHHHHRLLGGGVRHHIHHRRVGAVHHRLNSWQRFVKAHMRPGLTLRHLATMYHSHQGHVGVRRLPAHRIYLIEGAI